MTEYYWPDEARTKHLYIPGTSGYGKTTLMASLALEDICDTDDPVIVIDPKGSREGLVERILPHIPKERLNDIVYLSLRNPVPLDILGYSDESDKALVTGDIIEILRRFSFGSWGPLMQGTLRRLIPTLLEAQDTTFLDIGAFLESDKRRTEILDQVSQERQDYWKVNVPSKQDRAPIANRIANFDELPLKTIVSAKRGEGINIADLIERNKVFLVDTSPLTEDGLMLGALVMSRIQQAIFRRDPDKHYRCCHVYADEFHNFLTPAFKIVMSQARSFNLSLCVANQHPKQIGDLLDDVKACISSYVIFRMDGEHIASLRSKIKEPPFVKPEFDPKEIQARIDFLNECKDCAWERVRNNIDGDPDRDKGYTYEAIRPGLDQCDLEIGELQTQLEQPTTPPLSLLEQIPSLPVGAAIYVAHDGTTQLVRTGRPIDPPVPNHADEIKKATYAQSAPKCSVDNVPSNSPPISHNEGNGSNDDKPDEIGPETAYKDDKPQG